jgi:hypothetical protein
MMTMTASLPPATAADALLALLELVNNPTAAADKIRSLREQEIASQAALTQSSLKLTEVTEAQRVLERQRQEHAAAVRTAEDNLFAEKARWAETLQKERDQLASERTALEKEKQAVEKLKASLEQRMARITAAAA